MEEQLMHNIIQRDLTINASAGRIYNAIATAEQLIKWFPDKVEGDYQLGGQPVFSFGDKHRNSVFIQDATPDSYFAYRWVPGANQFIGDVRTVPNTLVEIRITEIAPGRCTVSLTESGFADLPEEIADASFNQNNNGWDFMLGRLQQLFSAQAR
jgi:uncharacterized protein YndB with AHSA1/START domain